MAYNQQHPSELTGYVLSAYTLTYMIGSIVIGHFALKSYGCKFCLLTGLFLGGGAWLLFAALEFMTEWKYFLGFSIVLRLTIGLGVASVDVSSFSLVLTLYPDMAGCVSGLMSLTWSLGAMIGPLLGGILYDWMGFIMPAGIVGLCLLFFSFVAVFVPTVGSSRPSYILLHNVHVSTKCYIQKLCSLWMILSFVSVFLIVNCLAFPQATLSAFLHTNFKFSPRDVGFVFLVGGVPTMLLTPVVGKLCDVMHPRWLPPSGIIMAVGGFFLMSFGHSIVMQYLAQVLLGFGSAFTFCSSYTDLYKELCRKLQEDKLDDTTTEKLYSVYTVFTTLGGLVGSAVGGVSVDSIGFGDATIIWGAIAPAFGVVYLLIFAIVSAWNRVVKK